jgi:predicted HicB family RNase H-like nuclease
MPSGSEYVERLRREEERRQRADEPQSVITVRLPRSLHAALKEQAKRLGVSLNHLCVGYLAYGTVQPPNEESTT